MSDDEEMRYCANCGDPEFDKDDEPTHDYEPYDHDFEPEEDGITIQDVKDGLDVIGKGLDVANKYKKLTETTTPRPPNPPPSPNLGSGRELDKAIRDAKKQAKPQAFQRDSAKTPSHSQKQKAGKKELGSKNLMKRFGKWILGAIGTLILAYIFWTYIVPQLPKG